MSDEDGPLENQLNEIFARLAKSEAAYAKHLHRGELNRFLKGCTFSTQEGAYCVVTPNTYSGESVAQSCDFSKEGK